MKSKMLPGEQIEIISSGKAGKMLSQTHRLLGTFETTELTSMKKIQIVFIRNMMNIYSN